MPNNRKCLPFDRWPALDQQLWCSGTRPAGLFEVAGAGAEWSLRSRDKTERGYGRWLSWLQASGQFDDQTHPGDRVDRARVATYLAEIATTCAPWTQACRIQELHDALRVLAPKQDWDWLAGLLVTLRLRARPVRNKRQRLRPAEELIALGERLMRQAGTAPGWSPRRQAVHYRDGLIIALLAYRPLRIKNFAALCLGQHLVQKSSRFWLLVSAQETKARIPYEVAFPDALVGALRRYLDRHRPVLLRGEHGGEPAQTDSLWISEIATQLDPQALATRISKHTRAAFGMSLPPHWFRDAAATTLAVQDPQHVRDARHVLGHASLATTERHYIQAYSLHASRRHQEMLARLRTALNPGGNGVPRSPKSYLGKSE